MKKEDPVKPAPILPIPAGGSTVGSGEGASTALEALIRKRKQAETPIDPEAPDPIPPLPPAFPAPAFSP